MFSLSSDCTYQMPAHFGGQKGPPVAQTYHDVTTILVSYETDGDAVSSYVPEGFRLAQPVVSVLYAMNRGVEWLAGGGYNVIGVNVPVTYLGGGEPIAGSYALVMWENRTCPILGGREQTGIPKIFADIEDLHVLGQRVFAKASYEGTTFLGIDFRKEAAMGVEELGALGRQSAKLNWFGWRYIPNIGRPGAALSHATLYPIETQYLSGSRGSGTVRWLAPAPDIHPTQAHIIDALSRLPIRGYRECAMTRSRQVLRIDIARQLP